MANNYNFEITGLKEVESVLKRLPAQISQKVRVKALKSGANIIAREIRSRAPGGINKIVRVRKTNKRQKGIGFGEVIIGFEWPKSKLVHLFEFGTAPRRQKTTGRFTGQMPAKPFIRPAIDATGEQAIKKMGQVMVKETIKAAERLAGKFKTSGLARRRR